MNNFNDYYNYLNNYNDMNFMTNPNTMITDMNYQNMFPNNYTIPNTNTNSSITDSQTGFKRGNLFNNLYDEYKNYKPQELITIYESKYGPMTLNSPVQTNIWLWNNSPWPWEVQK